MPVREVPPEERRLDFREVNLGYTLKTLSRKRRGAFFAADHFAWRLAHFTKMSLVIWLASKKAILLEPCRSFYETTRSLRFAVVFVLTLAKVFVREARKVTQLRLLGSSALLPIMPRMSSSPNLPHPQVSAPL